MLLQRKFRHDGRGWVSGRNKGKVWLCDFVLREIFEIPAELSTLWLSFHERPALNRAAVATTIPQSRHDKEVMVVYVDDKKTEVDRNGAEEILRRFKDKTTVYLQCKYLG